MLSDETILLRAPEPEDLEFLYQWENDTSLWQYGNTQAPLSRFVLREYLREAAKDIYSTRQLRLMICMKDQPSQAIGAVDLFDFDPLHLRAGVGILLDQAHRKQGFAAQSLGMIKEYARVQLGLHQLFCSITENNPESISLFESSGFELCGVQKHWTRIGSRWYSQHLYQCLLIPENEYQ